MFFLAGLDIAYALSTQQVFPALLAVAFVYAGVKLMRQRNEQFGKRS